MIDNELMEKGYLLDPLEFRNVVAKFVKSLIMARWKADPGFLSPDDLQRWKLENIEEDKRRADQHLHIAALTLGHINTVFIPRCGSGGVLPIDNWIDDFAFSVAFFVLGNKGGSPQNETLLEAVAALRAGETVDWEQLADWKLLNELRDGLDRLSELCGDQHDEANNLFYPNEDIWVIQFSGIKIFLGGKGCIDLWNLIRTPGRSYSYVELSDLYRLYLDEWKTKQNSFISPEEQSAEHRLAPHVPNAPTEDGNVDDITDAETISAIKNSYRNLDSKLETVEPWDEQEREALKEEKQKLVEHYKKITFKGKTKSFSDVKRKSYQAVKGRVDRAMKEIKKRIPDLFDHFDDSVNLENASVCYSPKSPVDWQTSGE